MNQLADFNQICMDITFGHDKSWIGFGDLDLIFMVTAKFNPKSGCLHVISWTIGWTLINVTEIFSASALEQQMIRPNAGTYYWFETNLKIQSCQLLNWLKRSNYLQMLMANTEYNCDGATIQVFKSFSSFIAIFIAFIFHIIKWIILHIFHMQNTIIWEYKQNLEQLSQNPAPKWNSIRLVRQKFYAFKVKHFDNLTTEFYRLGQYFFYWWLSGQNFID